MHFITQLNYISRVFYFYFHDYFTDSMDPDLFEVYFSGLYTALSFFNIFLPFVSGRLRDTLGDKFAVIMMASLVPVG